MALSRVWNFRCAGARFCRVAILVPLWLVWAGGVSAQIVVEDVMRADEARTKGIMVPYAFSSETFGAAAGVFAAWWDFPQEQAAVCGTAFGSLNGSWRAWIGAYDLRVPGTQRLFLRPDMMATSYQNVRTYIDGNPEFSGVRAGSNDSDPNDFVEDSGWDGRMRLNFSYLLPWAHGREHIINRVRVEQGVRVSEPVGGASWNPFESGRSYLSAEPFYRRQRIDLDEGKRTLRSNGLKLELRHDNTDFILNPSFGSRKRVAVTRDFGAFQSSDAWTHWELEYRRFIDLGTSGLHRQRVLALDAWLSDVPTWQTETVNGVERVSQRPPYFNGSTLGGFYRMRAFPVNRFSDRSALYYSAELRAMPYWNPLEGFTLFGSPEVEWWQWALFAEAGRVADDLDLTELHEDMKFDVGAGVRAFSAGLVWRLDMSFAKEDWSFIAMVGHSF